MQPDLEVKVKPSMHQRKLAEAKAQRMLVRDELWARRRLHEHGALLDEEERLYWEGGEWWGRGPPPHPLLYAPARRPETSDDRHVLAKHADIYPPEPQLQDIQRAVSHTERALKSLSDALADQARPKVTSVRAAARYPPDSTTEVLLYFDPIAISGSLSIITFLYLLSS